MRAEIINPFLSILEIVEYKNHILEKDYIKVYDNIKLDVNYEIINNIEEKKYIVDK